MRYNICILVLLLFVLSGCEKEINLEHMRPEPKLVLNCLAVQGDTLSVELSRTWFYADNKVKDIFVSGADVKLYVNDVFRESLSEVAVKYEGLISMPFVTNLHLIYLWRAIGYALWLLGMVLRMWRP